MNKSTLISISSPIHSREVLTLAAILLIAVLVRIPGLMESLWFDEVWYTLTEFANPDSMIQVVWKDVHPPLYPLTLMAWTDLFGDSEIAVRIPSFLCGLGSLALLWFIARRWLGQWQALLALALLALSPPHIWYSYENKVNMMLLLFSMAAVWLYWRASETRRPNDWIIATITMIAALYTHAYAVPVAAAIYLWLAWRAINDRSLFKPLFATGVVVALVFAPMILMKFGQRADLGRVYLRQLSFSELYTLFLIWLPSGNTFRTGSPDGLFAGMAGQPWPYFLIEAFFALLIVRGLLVIGRRARGDGWLKPVPDPASTEPARLMLLWIILPLALTIVGSLVSENFYIERNLLVILPPFLLVLAAGTDIASRPRLRTATIAILVSLSVAATTNLRFFKSADWTVYKYKPDWRSAALYLDDESRLNDSMRVLVTVPTSEYLYYQRQIMSGDAVARPESLYIYICNDPKNVLRTITIMGWPTLYLVENKTWRGCWEDVWESVPTIERLQLVEQKDFKGLTIYKFSVNR